MLLVERDEALALLTRLLDEAERGKGRTAMVTGTVATGKSTLLDAFTDAADDRGALTLSAVGSAAETGLPLGVLGQLLHRAPLLPAEQQRVAALLGSVPDSDRPEGPDLDTRTVRELCAVLLDVSERTPLVLVVDDVHLADRASLGCLAYLTRRVRNARIMAAFGHTDQAPHRQSNFRIELLRHPHSHHVPLDLISPAGVVAVAADRFGAEAAARIAEDCHTVSGGNPMLLAGLLDDHQAALRSGRPADTLTVADGYGQAVLDCLRRGGPQFTTVAQALAVLGAPESVDRLLGLDVGAVAQTLHGLNSAGLLDNGRYRHPAGRSAVLMDLDSGQRIELHRKAAELAHADGAPARVIAEHLLAACHAQTPWALPVLEEAAMLALSEGHVGPAVEYLKLACAACEDEPQLAKLRTTLVRAEWRINPSASTPHLADLTEAARAGHLRGSDVLVLAKALLWHGRFEDARDVLTRLSESTANAAADPDLTAELRTTRPWMRCSYAPFLDYMPTVDPDPGTPGTPSMALSWRLEATTALDSVLTHGPNEQVVAEAERILGNARLDDMGMDTVESALLALTYGEQAHRAAPWCDGLIEQAITRQSPGRQARLNTIRAEISVRQGDLLGAERHARQALEIIPPSSWGVTVGASRASLLMALTGMGRYDEAMAELNQPVPEAMLQSRYGLHYLHARGRCNLSTGHVDAALDDFRACGDLMGRWGLDVPGLIAWRSDAAEAWLRMGETDRARKLIEEQLERSAKGSPRAHGGALRLLAATYELRQRPALLRQAADILQTSGDRYELARALTDLTEAYHALGELRRARMIGRRAWDIAQECHAQPLSRLLALDAGQGGGEGNTGPVEGAELILSDAERRVADLAALGYTNREIAKRLYVTVSTVEQHLTRAYRKLNVTSRADLPTAMASVATTG